MLGRHLGESGFRNSCRSLKPHAGETLLVALRLSFLMLLQLGNNGICSEEDVSQLKELAALRTVYLEHNPVARMTGYRDRLKLELPQLTQLDATSI
jgi:hypothetical protein